MGTSKVVNSKLIVAFTAFASSVVFGGIISFSTPETYAFVLIACMWFFIGWLSFERNLGTFFARPTVFLFTMINAVRYIVLPTMILIGTLKVPASGLTTSGCFLYLYEEVTVCFFMSYLLKKKYRKQASCIREDLTQDNSYILYILIMLLAAFAVVMSPDILNAYNFILSQNTVYSSIRLSGILNGFWGIIYKMGFLLFPCLIAFAFYKIFLKTKSKSFAVLFAATLLLTTLGFSEGTSRNSALVPAMAALFLLIKCFPKKKKTILISIGTVIVLGFVMMTIAKLAFINSYSGKTAPASLDGITNMIQAYFSGPTNFSMSIETKSNFQSMFTFHTWINDIFGNWPVLSKFTDPKDRTTVFYNIMYYGRSFAYDQIIPTTGQGIFHLGYAFSVVPICLFMYMSALFDSKACKTNDYVKSYIYSYAAVRFVMALIANISIMSAFIGAPLIEILVIIFLTGKLPKKRPRKAHDT